MRCSDCKYFKTNDCTVNPEGEDCSSAEIFACFKSSQVEELRAASVDVVVSGKKADGLALFLLGMAVLVIGLALAMTLSLDIDSLGMAIAFLIGGLIGGLLVVIGAITFFIGWRRQKRQRDQYNALDSNSDYNKTVKKP